MSDAIPPSSPTRPPPAAESASESIKYNPLPSGIQQKPKNLENAMWVGNLPTDTNPEELRDFFYDEDFMTVFHISKTHCAFVNYKSYEAVLRAVKKHHEAEFHGIRLVCRPRKHNHPHPAAVTRGIVPSPRHLHNSIPPVTSSDAMPMLPPPMMYLPQGVTGSMRFNQYPGDPRFQTVSTMPPPPPSAAPQQQQASSPLMNADYRPRRTSQLSRSSRDSSPRSQQLHSPQERHASIDSSTSNPSVRYFILKSLTTDDLDISVDRGVWATQPHNEASLTRAFKTSSAVYLIFSANKSGEFYGYARMLQPIVPNPASSPSAQIQWTPVPMDEEEEENDPTKPSVTTDDNVEDNAVAAAAAAAADASTTTQPDDNIPAAPAEENHRRPSTSDKRWGNAFKVQWIKVQRLPFSQTRHLRNSWNNNREVKVSRDGTELETTVGEMLLQGFHWAEQQQLYQQQQQPQPQQQQPPAPAYQPVMYNNDMPQQMMMGYIQTPHGLQLVPIPFVGLGMPPTPYPFMMGEFKGEQDGMYQD